ncbi:hypothetical protein P0D88_06080 [Paraburkholderia sp. RL18-103-BIB-C]|uniref:hypothetical protein n=1 Tax=Paraburkholderia sp. RL18-103-BIB-C TaxID=3031637 RepID=UPI0038B95D71
MLDPIDYASERQFEKLVENFVCYCTEDEDQMARVKPMNGARTLTMGTRCWESARWDRNSSLALRRITSAATLRQA